MAKINWTEEAAIWLRDIYDYIAKDNPVAAEKLVKNIYDKVQVLSAFPETGHKYDKYKDRHIRVLLYGHYRIAYLIKEHDYIEILGVFHGALDIGKYLL